LRGGHADDATAVAPKVLKECELVAKRFVQDAKAAENIPNFAIDYCTATSAEKKMQYVCVEFRDAISMILEDVPPDTMLTAESFCHIAETRVAEAGRAVHVPRIGTGPLHDFDIAHTCINMTRGVLGGDHKPVARGEAGDVWYNICLNQDCAHHLPSRSKWCDVDRAPTHSAWVCESSRRHMHTSAKKRETEKISASELCGLYDKFVDELNVDVDAYHFVMHSGNATHVPVPGQEERALTSSQLHNDKGGRDLQRESGKPVH